MQRTVHGTNVKYALIEKTEGGHLAMIEGVYKSTEKDTKKAIKDCRKVHPDCAIVGTEEFATLYVLDDEIFFKYAVPVENTETNEK